MEKTFRGRTLEKPVEVLSVSYKADYILIPKDQEKQLLEKNTQTEERILPQFMEMPPLLREFIIKETGNPNPLLKVKIRTNREKIARIAIDGEEPNVKLTMSLGTPASKKLYANVNV